MNSNQFRAFESFLERHFPQNYYKFSSLINPFDLMEFLRPLDCIQGQVSDTFFC